jgi:cobalt-zinc-cadmium resistance protein CzcA
MQLREMQDWIVARQLIGTPGVAEVISFGGHLKQYEVAIDPIKIKSMNVSIPEVFAALQAK